MRKRENRVHASPRNTWKVSQKHVSTDNGGAGSLEILARLPIYPAKRILGIGAAHVSPTDSIHEEGNDSRNRDDKERTEEAEKGAREEEIAAEPI